MEGGIEILWSGALLMENLTGMWNAILPGWGCEYFSLHKFEKYLPNRGLGDGGKYYPYQKFQWFFDSGGCL